MDPWSWRSGWKAGSDEEEIRKIVAAARQRLLSECFEAVEGMMILPGGCDPQEAQVLGEMIMTPTSCHGLLPWTLHDRLYIFCYSPRTSEAEEIFFAIQKLRNENWVYRQWGVRISAQYHLTEKLKAVLDRADKFLSAGKTTLHGQAQVTEGRNTRLVIYKQEDSLDQLDAFSDPILTNKQAKEMESVKLLNSPYEDRARIALSKKGVQYEEKAENMVTKSELLLSCNPVHAKVPVIVAGKPHCEFIDEALVPTRAKAYADAKMSKECAGKIWKGGPNISSFHASGCISEKPKTESTNTGSACKDVHDLTENYRMYLARIEQLNRTALQRGKDRFMASSLNCSSHYMDSVISIPTFPIKMLRGIVDAFSSSDKDQTSSVKHGASSFILFSVKTSPKGGVDIKMGSHKMHVPKYGSVHRPLVQMVLFAQTLSGGTLAYLKSMLPKSIVNLYESVRISEKPKTWSTSTGSACKNADDLSIAELENDGAPNSSNHDNIEAEDKAAATWLIDTGAVHHATGKLDLISAIGYISDDLFMTARGGVRMRVHALGTVRTDKMVLPDVWYIPGLTKNIVSVSQLNQLGYSIGFTHGTCFIRSAADGTLIGKGHVSEDGLFEMVFLKVS